jgi:hypothetical protein
MDDKLKIIVKLLNGSAKNINGDCFSSECLKKSLENMDGKEIPFVSDQKRNDNVSPDDITNRQDIIGKAKLFVKGDDLYAEISGLDKNDYLPKLLKELNNESKEDLYSISCSKDMTSVKIEPKELRCRG